MDPATVAAYDANAGRYAADYDAAQPGAVWSFLLKFLPKARDILEIGCGSGRDARFMAGHGCTVTATDASDEMLRIAGRTATPGVSFGKAAFMLQEDDSLLQKRFDAVVALAVIIEKKTQHGFRTLVEDIGTVAR